MLSFKGSIKLSERRFLTDNSASTIGGNDPPGRSLVVRQHVTDARVDPSRLRSDLREDLLRETFRGELDDHVRAFNQLLRRVEREQEQGNRRALLSDLYREAHDLKGAAVCVEIGLIERLADALRLAFASAREDSRRPDGEWLDAMYLCVDAILPLYQASADGSTPPSSALLDMLVALETASPAARSSNASIDSSVPIDPQPAHMSSQVPSSQGIGARQAAAMSIRVRTSKIDALIEQTADLGATRGTIALHVAQLRALAGESAAGVASSKIARLAKTLEKDAARLAVAIATFEDHVRSLRVVPIASLLPTLERVVRDVARETDKEARLLFDDTDVEVDRDVVQKLRGPLVHLLRNAVDHGIESPVERMKDGKPLCGSVKVAASQIDGRVRIQVEDDGAGLDPVTLRQTAVARGLLSAEQAARMDDERALYLIIQPGFTTRTTITTRSGRGVGMDAVREAVEELGGSVQVASRTGEGTQITIDIPFNPVGSSKASTRPRKRAS